MVGSNPSRENSPSYIDTAISAGYDVEVDINYFGGKFYLGHDTHDYEISESWMENRKNNLWFHCKNLDSAEELCRLSNFQFFCHSTDVFVLTSTNHIWVHDLSMNLNKSCIIPLLSIDDLSNYDKDIVYAICTDYINFAEFNLKQKGLYK
jgi:hypothetical protein